MFEKRILNIYSVIVGVFFLISGIGKVINTTGFSNLIYQYGFGYLMILSPLIVIIEILLGLFLILLINPKRHSLFSFLLLITFTASFAYGHFKHGVNDCGCLGSLHTTNASPIFSFTRNFVLIIMTLIVWIKYPKEKIEIVKWKKYLIWLFICPAIFISGFTFNIPYFLTPNPNNHRFQNQNIKNTELSKYINTSPDSTYLIFCFTYTCPHCLNSIENLRQYEKSNTVDNVLSFANGADSSKLFFNQSFNPDFYIKDLPIDAMLKLTDLFPTAFYIKHDSIKVVIQGELPSHVIFKKQYNLSNS